MTQNIKNKNGNVSMERLQSLIDELSHEDIIAGGTDRKITNQLNYLYSIRNTVRKSLS